MALDAPPPELDQDALAKKFAAQFEAAENVRAYAWTNRPRDRATNGKAYRAILFAIFARATLTYRGILHLCRGGYTEQADMLTRSLFEDMAIGLWVSLPDHQKEKQIVAQAESTTCSYCGRTSDEPIACELDIFLGAVAEAIAVDWDDAVNFMPSDGGDWALPDVNHDIYDLLGDGDLEIEVEEELFSDIVEAFADRRSSVEGGWDSGLR
jgi:hypothetical protein